MATVTPRPGSRDAGSEGEVIDRIAERVLWLSVRMIHEANAVRPNPDGLKVGGHQASSASAVSLLTTLYLRWLRPGDLVSVKPHASPAYHALQYLMGGLDQAYLSRLREFGGLQPYPSRTKDPDRVDFSTGSVGLGAVAPLFAALTDRYLRAQGPEAPADRATRRFIALVGDAELDEGNVWEAAIEPALAGLGNVTVVVDVNRQSLDRVIPGTRIRQLMRMYEAAGWQVLEAKYGRQLEQLMARPGGKALRRRIDAMPNEEYQVLIRRAGDEIRRKLIEGSGPGDGEMLRSLLQAVPDDRLPALLSDLGGHDSDGLVRLLRLADRDRARPSVIFAYTIKGWRLPFAGDAMNHSALLSAQQIDALAAAVGVDPTHPWAGFDPDSPEGRLCRERGKILLAARPPGVVDQEAWAGYRIPDLELRVPDRVSTQQAFGDTLAALARVPDVGRRIVTASPDVTVSTSLGGWVNRVGVFAPDDAAVPDDTPRPLNWAPGPHGQHIELGLSEMNLFMWLSQAGLSAELFGEPLVAIGTVYDPFICRGLDALIYALYVGARFILVGTPSGVTLAPEGGAHQSTITPSIGIELPGLHSYEPAFAHEVTWILEDAIRAVGDRATGHSTYLRLSTRLVDQALGADVRARLGNGDLRRQVLAGGYRLIEAADHDGLPPGAPVVNVVATGSVISEAVQAVEHLLAEEVAANLIVVTSADRLAAELHGRRLASARRGTPDSVDHLSRLIPSRDRHAPMVTVADGASHALSFLGAAFGAPTVPLGVDSFGQAGRIADLYAHAGIDARHIVDAALLALELG
jgi:pyruvate dehydrogenase E1 component